MENDLQIAIVGLLAAIVGSLLTHGLQWLTQRSDTLASEQKERARSGAQIAYLLDDFSLECAAHINHNRWAISSGNRLYEGDIDLPKIPDFDEAEFLHPIHYSMILAIKVHYKVAQFQIGQASILTLPDEQVGIEETNRQLQRLAIISRKISYNIRKESQLPQENYDDKYFSITEEIKKFNQEK